MVRISPETDSSVVTSYLVGFSVEDYFNYDNGMEALDGEDAVLEKNQLDVGASLYCHQMFAYLLSSSLPSGRHQSERSET